MKVNIWRWRKLHD